MNLTVTATDPAAGLGGGLVRLTKGATVLSPSSWVAGTTTGTWVASFTEVPFGCWTPSFTLANHYGTLSEVTPGGSCASGRLNVPKVDSSTTVAAAKLKEAKLDATVKTTFAPPHTTLPAGAKVAVHVAVTAAAITYDGPGAVLWLPIGSVWSATASLDPTGGVFWPSRSDGGTLTAAFDAALDLTEKTRSVSVKVPGAGDGVTVTATGAGADAASLTLTATTDNGVAVLKLPSGQWSLTATVDGSDTSTDPPTPTSTDYEIALYLVDDVSADDVTMQKVSTTP